jgi:hypothetical protein
VERAVFLDLADQPELGFARSAQEFQLVRKGAAVAALVAAPKCEAENKRQKQEKIEAADEPELRHGRSVVRAAGGGNAIERRGAKTSAKDGAGG